MATPVGSSCPTCGRQFPQRAGYCPNDGSKLVEVASTITAEALLGRTLDGRYRIDSIVGLGSMATVYRGMQLSIDREVVIKVIHPAVANDADVAARLLAVGKLCCQITAPAIANTFDFGRTDDHVVYLVSELVRGRTLAHEIGGHAMAARRVVTIAIQVLDALESAHKKGLSHGHLTPSNIMLVDESSRRDVVKVVDFGLAPPPGQLAIAGVTGTSSDARHARYWAPEQFEKPMSEDARRTGAETARPTVDARTDLYALGCILYEALSGTPPFNDTSFDILRSRHLSATPPKLPPNVPAGLAAVVETMLAKAPDARFRFFADAKRALEPFHVAASTPITGLPTPMAARVVGKGEITAVTQPPPTGGTFPPNTPHPMSGTVPPNTPHPMSGTFPPNTPHPMGGTVPPNTPHPGSFPSNAPGTHPPGSSHSATSPPHTPYPSHPGTYPPGSSHPTHPSSPSASTSKRALVITLVAVLVSALGIAAYLLAT